MFIHRDEVPAHLRVVPHTIAAERGRHRVTSSPLATEILSEALADLERPYQWAIIDVKTAALDALARGPSRFMAEMQAAAVAVTSDPQPPPHLVRNAVEEARRPYCWLTKQVWRPVQ
jgi:hypothetical protein